MVAKASKWQVLGLRQKFFSLFGKENDLCRRLHPSHRECCGPRAVPGTWPRELSSLSLFLPRQHCAGCQSHQSQRPSGLWHPGTDVGSCEQWPCCRRQDRAGELMLCPPWSPGSTPPNVQARRISLYLTSKGEVGPISTFPFPTFTRSWPRPGCSCKDHTEGRQAVLSRHTHSECSIPHHCEFALCAVGFI